MVRIFSADDAGAQAWKRRSVIFRGYGCLPCIVHILQRTRDKHWLAITISTT